MFVIESIRPNEFRTGKALVERLKGDPGFGLKVEYFDCGNRAALFTALDSIAAATLQGVIPIIHIECHGRLDARGLVLASKESVLWNDLQPILAETNRRTALNLMVVLAACFGLHLATIVPTEMAPAPYWAVVAPEGEEDVIKISQAFPAFYAMLGSTGQLNSAMKAMHELGLHAKVFLVEELFIETFQQFVGTFGTEAARRKRARKFARRLDRPVKHIASDMLKLQEPLFEESRRTFFMIDEFPENDERFTVTFEEIKASVVT